MTERNSAEVFQWMSEQILYKSRLLDWIDEWVIEFLHTQKKS